MQRVLLLTVLTMAAIAPAGGAAVADPGGASITLVGTRTSFVDVRFNEKFQLDHFETKIDSKGDFAGWLIHPLGQPLSYDKGDFQGAYMIRDVAPSNPEYGPNLFSISLRERTFAPGLYRLYLFADGPVKVRIPMLEGATSKTIRPHQRTTARWTAEDIPLIAPRVVADSVSQPFRVKRDSLTFSSIYLYSDDGVTAQQTTQACLRESPEEAPLLEQNCERGGIMGAVSHPLQDYAFVLTYVYPPRSMATDNYYTFAKARAATVDRVMGVGFTIQLPGV
jgi:hypothetical protein